MGAQTIHSDLIRGHIDTMILRVLLDGDSYGYEIIKTLFLRSGQRYELKEPSLYTSLRRLEKQGYIESYWGNESQGGRRKYYHMTNPGRAAYHTAIQEWVQARDLIDLMLLGGTDDDRSGMFRGGSVPRLPERPWGWGFEGGDFEQHAGQAGGFDGPRLQ